VLGARGPYTSSTLRQRPRHLDGGLDALTAASTLRQRPRTPRRRPLHLDSGLDTSTAEALGDRGRKTVQMHSGASSAAYTAIRTELTTLNTADTTSSSSTGKGTMDIDGRAGATCVAVAGGTPANG
jgi:hypothetical protein